MNLTALAILFTVLLLPSLARAQSRAPRSPCSDPSARCFTDKQGNKFCGYQGQTAVLCSRGFEAPKALRSPCNDPSAYCYKNKQGNRLCGYQGQTAVLCSPVSPFKDPEGPTITTPQDPQIQNMKKEQACRQCVLDCYNANPPKSKYSVLATPARVLAWCQSFICKDRCG